MLATNKIGTLLYARDSDLLKCLSLALHDLHTCSLPRDIEVLPLQTIQTNDASLIRKAADIINYAIQEEIKKVKNTSKISQHLLSWKVLKVPIPFCGNSSAYAQGQ